MHAEDSIEIHAPAEIVWRVYRDVERWPEWTASIDQVAFVRGDAPGGRRRRCASSSRGCPA